MAKSTLVALDAKALAYAKKGVDAIYEPVRRTFGPEAGTTLMYRSYGRGPRCVDDGYYTAEVITPKNPFVKLVAEFFKEGTKKTNEKVGDGTTGTTIIAGVLFNDIYAKSQARTQGYSAGDTKKKGFMEMRREILESAKDIKDKIRTASKPVKTLEDLEKISAISLGEDNDTSKKIAHMAYEVGVEGFIDVVEGYNGEVETELIKGMRFPAKTCGKAFVNKPERHEMVIEDCPVFITNYKLDNDALVRYLVAKFGSSKLTIIAPDFSEQVLISMVLGRENATFVWPIKAPSLRTEQMEDLAVFFGASLVDKDKGHKLEGITGTEVGFVDKIIVKDVETREDVVALGGKGEKSTAVKDRIKVLQGQLKEAKEPQFKKLLERRIASLSAGGGVIRVGSPTDAESLPLKLKIEDCVYACKSALKSGYVKGGGLCLKEIADTLPDTHILKNALLAPHKQIQDNSGGALKIGKDVIDPTDAVYYAVEHATSVVSSLITVKTLVVEEPEMELGEGQLAIAQAINSFVKAWSKKEGIMTASEEEAEKDAMGGLTQDERVLLDQG